MKTFDGYKKRTLTDSNLLLASGGDKPLSDFIGTLNWDSTNRKLQYKKIGDTNWNDLVTFGSNALNSISYLPLTGGTLTDTNSTYILKLKGSTEGVGMLFNRNSTNSGLIINSDDYGIALLNVTAGYLGIGIKNNGTPYFKGSDFYTLWHAGNSNLSTINWTAKDLTAYGNIYCPNIGEGFEITGDPNYFGTNADGILFTFKDGNDNYPDGGMMFRANGKAGVVNLLKIRCFNTAINSGEFLWKGYDIYHAGNLSPLTTSNYSSYCLPLTGGTLKNNSMHSIHSLNATNGSADAWNKEGNTMLRLASTNNAMVFSIGSPNNERTGFIQVGHADINYADVTSALHLNKLGGTVYINNNVAWHAGNDGSGSGLDADLLDGYHANGLFTNLSNSGNNISITIGGTNKTLTPAYATNSDKLDGKHWSDIQIGGRNYYKHSSGWDGCTKDATIHGYTISGDTLHRTVNLGFNGYSGNWVLTAEVKADVECSVNVNLCDFGASTAYGEASQTTFTTSFVKHTWVFLNVNKYNTSDNYNGFLDLECTAARRLTLKNIKLEKGTKATDWSPAPEDNDVNNYLPLVGGTLTGKLTTADILVPYGKKLVTAGDWTNNNGLYMYESYDTTTHGGYILYGAADKLHIGTWNNSTTGTDAITISKGSASVSILGGLTVSDSTSKNGAAIYGQTVITKDLGYEIKDWTTALHEGPFEVGRTTNTWRVAIGVTNDDIGYIQSKAYTISSAGFLLLNPYGDYSRTISGTSRTGSVGINLKRVPYYSLEVNGTLGISGAATLSSTLSVASSSSFLGRAIFSGGIGNNYHLGAIEIQGNGSTNTIYPILGFHQPGIYAGYIKLTGWGLFELVDNGHNKANLTSQTFTSNIATGTAPFTVTSTTLVSNLNADFLDGYHASQFIHRLPWWGENASHNIDDVYNGTTFAYKSHNAPTNGIFVAFSGTHNSYQLQLQGQYYGENLYFRNKNGDNNTWNPWRYVIHNGNIGSLSVASAGYLTGNDPLIAAATENNEVYIKDYGNNSAGAVLGASANAGLRKAIRFRWYSNYWSMGILRGGSSNTEGMGWSYNTSATACTLKMRLDNNGNLTVANNFYASSDIRLKNIVNYLDISYKDLAVLPLFNFTWKDKEDSEILSGTSAQAVQEILPNIVHGNETLTLSYSTLGTIAGITACKELVNLKSEIDLLKERIKELELQLKMINDYGRC